MQRSDITTVNNITQAIANPATGDVIFLEIDETLLLTGFKKFNDTPKLTEPGLAAEILRLQERGIRVVGLTSRSPRKQQATLDQLKLAGMQFEVLHAPDIQSADGSLHSGKGRALHAYLEQADVKPRRLFVFDNLPRHLDAIKAECESFGIPLFLKHYVVPDFLPVHVDTTNDTSFPEKLDDYQKDKFLGGGTASVFSIKHQRCQRPLVLKLGAHEDAAKIEMLCNAIYHLLGVDVPKMRVYHKLPKKLAADIGLQHPYRFSQVCEFIQSGDVAPAEIIKKAARDHFVVHALLGNIDVAKENNFIVDRDLKPYLIDAGANFIFRSLGQVRQEAPHLVSEMETLRDQSINDKGYEWFGDLTDDEISQQLQNILARHKELTDLVWSLSLHLQLPDELRDKFLQCLADRIDALVTRFFCQSKAHAKLDKRADKHKTAAGILTYAVKNGEPYILLSKRAKHEWWDNFGGKSEAGDDSLLATARREVAEESGHVLNYTDLELHESPFHDIVTGERVQQLYRMYICQYDYVQESEFKDKEHTDHQWVPLRDIIDAVNGGEYKEFSGQKSVVVKSGKLEIPLYPPLFVMLQQVPVMQNLRELLQHGRMKRSHTLSYAEYIGRKVHAVNYQPLLTPAEQRQQIVATLEKKSRVLRQLKHKNINQSEVTCGKSVSILSQSEIHLKAMLGKHYKPDDLAANVREFIRVHSNNFSLSKDADVERLVQYSVALIEQERMHGDDHIYLYHACSNSIAFAYDVYTAIYQILQQDTQWSVFRPESEHFKRFLNISEFIAFYSNHGSQEINNNAKNYNDCALSANVFLFGNHVTSTSCSIHYLLNNDVRRQVDMAALFEELLRPFQVTSAEIKRILSLFAEHLHDQGGRLYQIAMSVEQARQMSYPSGCVGVMNPLNGDHVLPSVLHTLRVQAESKDSITHHTHDYIKHLQARVMVPPHLKLSTTEIRWKPMTAQAEAAYRATLTRVVSAMVHKMLCHYDLSHASDIRPPLLKVLPVVLQGNQLSLRGHNSDEILVSAILADDIVTVKNILQAHPGLLQKMIHPPGSYINSNCDKPDSGEISILGLLLTRKKIPLNIFLDFSNHDWIEHINAIKVMNFDNFKRIIKRLPDTKRLLVVINHSHLLDTSVRILAILALLPQQDRFEIASKKALTIRSHADVSNVAKLLPLDQRLVFLREQMNRFVDFIYLLKELPIEQRLAEVNLHQDLLISPETVFDVIKLLPLPVRFDFATSHQLIPYIIATASAARVSQFISIMPQDKQLLFAITQQYKIKNFYDLSSFLSGLPSDAVEGFLHAHQDKIDHVDDLAWALKYLDVTKRSAFLRANEHKIKSGDNLSVIIECMATNIAESFAFAVRHRDKILSVNMLYKILYRLPASWRLTFAKDSMALVKNEKDIDVVLGILPAEDRREFLSLAKVPMEYYLYNILSLIPAQHRFELALANIANCIIPKDIINIFNMFQHAQQKYALAMACQENIMTNYRADWVQHLLDKEDMMKFMAANISYIGHLQFYLKLLPDNQRAAAVAQYGKYICNIGDLLQILPLLSLSERKVCVLAHQDLIGTVHEKKTLGLYRVGMFASNKINTLMSEGDVKLRKI